MLILVINTGASSTKLAIYEDETLIEHQVLKHEGDNPGGLLEHSEVTFRAAGIRSFIDKAGLVPSSFDAIGARGGLLRPLEGGVYRISEKMLEELSTNKRGRHASNYAAQLAHLFALEGQVPAFIVDPVTVDEFWDVSRLSGHPEIPRRSLVHALNIKSVVRKAVAELKLDIGESAFVVVHMGSGTSVAAVLNGLIVDVNDANNGGPFSAERSGGLPVTTLLDWYSRSGISLSEAVHILTKRSGLRGYLGTSDVKLIVDRIQKGDSKAKLVLEAMCYQVAKEIGAMTGALGQNPHAIVLTGGIAWSEWVVDEIKRRIEHICPVLVYPGERELEALAEGCLRVLRGEVEPKEY